MYKNILHALTFSHLHTADRAIREMNRKEKDIVRAYFRAVKYASQIESRVRIMLIGDEESGTSSSITATPSQLESVGTCPTGFSVISISIVLDTSHSLMALCYNMKKKNNGPCSSAFVSVTTVVFCGELT